MFQRTAREVAETDEDTIYEYMKERRFRLASFNSRDRDAMFEAIIADNCIEGGWFYQFCFPGCLPDSEPFGPYATRQEAIEASKADSI